ncbi:rhomboid family intramembrane serine protease [Sanguibacter sp. 25GB23B1]|uniref:rhomboid family intramembrane serine protease n=1 Tax=unclassified Sanguibacter TaxID=2645534 RepID=UPI0032AEE021
MVQAPVGVQCVDCVREAQSTVRPARTVLGAPVRAGQPVVTLSIITLCAVSYLLQLTLEWEDWTSRWAFAPVLGDVEPWRFLTSAFMHSQQPLHILLNMYALWIVGPELERMLGRARFVGLYVLSAIGGSVAVLLFSDPTTVSWFTGTVGASGAVFGLFGAILIVLRRLGRDARAILVIIGLNFAIGFFVPNISWQGHLGGLVTGTLLGALYAFAPRAHRRAVSIVGTSVVAVILVAAAMLRYASI